MVVESIKKKFKVFYWVTITLYTLAISGYFFDVLHELNSLENSLTKILIEVDLRENRLNQLKNSLGYGGMIHNYKNYLLRREPSYYSEAISQSKDALLIIEELQLDKSEYAVDQTSLDAVKNMIFDYQRSLEIIKNSSDLDIRALDQKVRVEDSSAIESINTMIRMNKELRSIAVSTAKDKVYRLKNALYFVTFFGLSFFVAFFTFGYFRLRKIQDQYDEERQSRIHNARLSELQEMSGTLAHEINNPLTIIRGAGVNLKRKLEKLDDNHVKLIKNCDLIVSTVDRVSSIVTSLKKMSHKSEDQKPTYFLLDDVIQDISNVSRDKMYHAGVKFRVSLEEDFLLLGYRNQIAQVVLNLVNNSFDAIKKSDEKWINIEAHSDGDFIYMKISDSGPKLSQEVISKLMTPFYTTKPVGKGTGIGLSISKMIAEEHQGKLEFIKDDHTTFCLKLPLVKSVHHKLEKAS